jgi:hypothetical protein
VIDAVRCAKLGLDHGLKGALIAPSSYFKKSPPHQFPDDYCRAVTEAFIKDPKGTEARIRTVVAERDAAKRAAQRGTKKRGAAQSAPSRDGGRKHAMARAAVATRNGSSANGDGNVGARVAARAATAPRRKARKRATARAR